ncbi:MAG: glutamine amidotransferase [Bryobacteraceae bacterium]
MFEFLFKYPASAFSRGTIVFLGSWPKWILVGGILAAAATLAFFIWRGRSRLTSTVRGWHAAVLWLLQSALLATLLLLLWQPAISVTSLRPQQNIIAVIVDDSRSMSAKDGSETRSAVARRLLDSNLLNQLGKRFQVRLYQMGAGVKRVNSTAQLSANQPSTQIGKSLRQVADEAATLPIGAAVLLTDGADNSGGLDGDTLSEIRRRRLPVSTVGIGSEQVPDDVELTDFSLPTKTLAGARLQAEVTIRQHGFSGKKAKLVLTNAGTVLATREIALQSGPEQHESVEFHAGKAAVKSVTARIDPIPGETNANNNAQTRTVAVDDSRRRILYVEGEPRWDYKFLRRAVEDDPAIQVVSMLRTTQNKIYRQGIANPNELAEGFPSKPEALFDYQGLILGSVEAAFFTTGQQQIIKDFVDRRGGGALFLGGRACLADGGYNVQPFAELLPVNLPNRKNTFQRTFVPAELTEAGKRSLVCRIDESAEKSIAHWDILPYLANYQDPGTPKPGATVLARVNVAGNHIPLLVTENYGRGRTAVFATGGSWRWHMQQPVGDTSEETFWRQLLRWTVSATPSRVVLSTKNATLEDDGQVELRAEVRDNVYLPTSSAEVQVHMVAPDGTGEDIPLRPEPLTQGVYTAKWNAPRAGLYVAEARAKDGVHSLGKDTWAFRREDGVAENFHREANHDLLRRLADQTGGRYYKPQDVSRLPAEVAYSEAGITSRELKDLWDMPAILLFVLTLKSTEWLLRRRWGVV